MAEQYMPVSCHFAPFIKFIYRPAVHLVFKRRLFPLIKKKKVFSESYIGVACILFL